MYRSHLQFGCFLINIFWCIRMALDEYYMKLNIQEKILFFQGAARMIFKNLQLDALEGDVIHLFLLTWDCLIPQEAPPGQCLPLIRPQNRFFEITVCWENQKVFQEWIAAGWSDVFIATFGWFLCSAQEQNHCSQSVELYQTGTLNDALPTKLQCHS